MKFDTLPLKGLSKILCQDDLQGKSGPIKTLNTAAVSTPFPGIPRYCKSFQ